MRMNQGRRGALIGALVAIGLASLPAPSHAESFGFECLTNNSAGNCAAGETQLLLNVVAPFGPLTAQFEFLNTGGTALSITDIYFDEPPAGYGSVLGWPLYFLGFDSSPGVKYEVGANPPVLPGGNNATPNFAVSESFQSKSGPGGVMANGINPGEFLRINFALLAGFDTLIDMLTTGTLRVGLHVQGFGNGGSESFLAGPGGGGDPAPVPEPASLLLLGSGLTAAAAYARRRRAVAVR